MRCLGLQLLIFLSLTQCTTVYSLPQGIAKPEPPHPASLVSELLSAASQFQASTAGSGGGSSGGQTTATVSSAGSGTGASTATQTPGASSGQTAATATTGTAAAGSTGTVSGTGTQGSNGGTASVTGSASNSQGTAGTDSGASATDAPGATSASNSASPANTGDPNSGSGGANDGGSGGDDNGDGNGGGSGSGSGSGSGADTQNKGSSSSALSQGELAAVIVLPILALFAILFLIFWFCRPLRERFTTWRQERNERGAYRRALDDPVGVFAIKHRRRSTGLSLPDMQSIMRPLSFGFSAPQRQAVKRKPLNWDASRIGGEGFNGIGMAVPAATERDDGGDGHQRNESEVSAITHPDRGTTAVGRPRTDSNASSVSSISSSDEESTGFVDARTSQRASQITS